METCKSFPILQETLSYKRFIRVWNRKVKFPDGRIIEWDVAGHNTHVPAFSTVFPFDTDKKQITVLTEYAQGPNEMLYTLAAGGFDPSKHASIEETGIHELSEEAQLTGGKWIPLSDPTGQGIPELKWCRNRFIPFLVLDPVRDPKPRARDAEEMIEIHSVTIPEWKKLILRGKVSLPAVQTSLMALEWLKENHYITESLL